MALLRLRTQLVIATLVIIFALTGAVLLIIRQSVHSEITKQVQGSTDASLHAFETVQRERERDLELHVLRRLPRLGRLHLLQRNPLSGELRKRSR